MPTTHAQTLALTAITDGTSIQEPSATVHIYIAPPQPIARDDFYSGLSNTAFSPPAGKGLLRNDSSPIPNPQLEVTGHGPLSNPAAGTLKSVDPDGNFLFEPADGWTGTVTFPYTVTDRTTGLNASAVAHITITSSPPPVAGDDSYVCAFGEACSIPVGRGVLANDSSPTSSTITIVSSTDPVDGSGKAAGSVTLKPDGSFVWTPPAGWVLPAACGACFARLSLLLWQGDWLAGLGRWLPAAALCRLRHSRGYTC